MIVFATVVAVGRPAVFTDTRDYFIHGARFYQAVRRTVLGETPPPPRTAEEERVHERLLWQMHFDHSNAGARSPYYGIFLYTLAHRGTLWLLTAVQSLICAWLLNAGFAVSVTESVCVPAVFSVAVKVWLPASAAVKV